MKCVTGPTKIKVVLSERNLITLLSKIFVEDSARTLQSRNVYMDMSSDPLAAGFDNPSEIFMGESVLLEITAESDEVHYGGRFPAGYVHPTAERVVREIQVLLKEGASD